VTLDDIDQLRFQVHLRHDSIDEIGPIEDAHQHVGIAKLELINNVLPHTRRGSRRVCVQTCPRKFGLQSSKLAILRAEVVAPLADAVGFIDRKTPSHRRFESSAGNTA
jgi:hypothetical protein